MIDILFEAGAKEVHFRSASPVVVEESYFGVNIDPNNKLMGSYMSVEEIRKAIGATTLDYLSLKNLKKILESDEAVLVECIVEKEENVYPMIPAGKDVSCIVGKRGVLENE